jgi:phosphoribosylformylglycinamidine synthase
MSTGLVRSCHDCSEGGLAVTIAEMCIAGGFGAHIDVLPTDDAITAWFSESSGRLVVEVRRGDLERFLDLMEMEALVIGEVTADPVLRMAGGIPVPLANLDAAWSGGTS